MTRRPAWYGLIAAVAVASCGSGDPPSPNTPVCNVPVLAAVQMLYPPPGSMSVPDNVGVIVYQSYSQFPITVTTDSATITAQPTAVPSPMPSPLATSLPQSGAQIFAAAIPDLSASSTYSVSATYAVTPSVCVPTGQIDVSIGSFTTR